MRVIEWPGRWQPSLADFTQRTLEVYRDMKLVIGDDVSPLLVMEFEGDRMFAAYVTLSDSLVHVVGEVKRIAAPEAVLLRVALLADGYGWETTIDTPLERGSARAAFERGDPDTTELLSVVGYDGTELVGFRADYVVDEDETPLFSDIGPETGVAGGTYAAALQAAFEAPVDA